MRVPPRLFAVLLFVALGMLTLVVAGLLDWIVGVLFLAMEFLGETLRVVFRRRRDRRHFPTRYRHASISPPVGVGRLRSSARHRGHPHRGRTGLSEAETTPANTPGPRSRLLVPVGGDEPELIAFALEECRVRRAEMILLFLRPLAIMPMGPIPLPGLSEDGEARATFQTVGTEAARLGVPLRTIYETTTNRPATIGAVARACEADFVVVGSRRRSLVSRLLSRDLTSSLLGLLPERASLMIRTT